MSKIRFMRTTALALCLVTFGCTSGVILKHTPGTTYGDIMVGDARVSSRERLINDRLVQDSWLRDQLSRSDQQDFGTQGAADLRSYFGFSARVEANVSQPEIDLYRKNLSQLEDSARQREQADLDNQLERAYKQRQLEALSQQPASAFSYTPPKDDTKAGGTSGTAPSAPASPTAIESLRGLDTSKLTIDPSTMRLPDKLKPTPQEVLRDKLDYRDLIRNEIISNALDDRHDLKGHTLLRFDLDATVRPENDTSAWASIEVELDNTRWREVCGEDQLYDKWINFLERSARDHIFLLMTQGQQAGRRAMAEEGNPSGLKGEIARIRGMVVFLPEYLVLEIQRSWALMPKAGAIPMYGYPPYEKKLNANMSHYATAQAIIIEQTCNPRGDDGAPVGSPIPFEKLSREDFARTLHNEISKAYHRIFNELLPDYVSSSVEYGILHVDKKKPQSDKHETDADVVRDFCAALGSKVATYAYAITPRETVQRIGEVASRRNVNEFLLGLSFLAGSSAAGKAYTDFLQANEGVFQALRRQPLIVGYSNGSGRFEMDQQKSPATRDDQGMERLKQQVERWKAVQRYGSPSPEAKRDYLRTRFGWILGPRFVISDDGKEARNRQTLSPASLSAVVSVPGWLSQVDFKVTTKWIPETGSYGMVVPKVKTKTLPIRINPDLSSIFDLLSMKPIREPRPATRPLLDFDEGSPAMFVIPGQNLWRNPAVLLGTQQADEISVLPDMRGLVAKFKEVRLQNPKDEFIPLVVWTSEGNAEAGLVKIKPSKGIAPQPKAPTAALVSKVIAVDTPLEVQLDPPQRAFNKMTLFVGTTKTGRSVPLDISTVQKDGALVSVKTPPLAEAHTGDDVLVQVVIKASPDMRQPQPFGGPLTGVYFAKAEEAKALVQPLHMASKELPKTFTVVLPEAADRIYPGSEGELTVALDPSNGAPAADVTPCMRSSLKGDENKCTFSLLKFAESFKEERTYTVKLSTKDGVIPLRQSILTVNAIDKSRSGTTVSAD